MSSVITRKDNLRFILRPYREEDIFCKSSSILSKELQFLSKQHGQYLCVTNRTKNKVSVAFSQEVGFLFAESLIAHFNRRLHNFVFCEFVENIGYLLVVIANGRVHTDGLFASLGELQGEFAILSATNEKYDIHAIGIEISSDEKDIVREGVILLDKELIANLTLEHQSMFNSIQPNPKFLFQSLQIVLRSLTYGVKEMLSVYMGIAVVIFIFFIIFFVRGNQDPATATKLEEEKKKTFESKAMQDMKDSFGQYRNALSSISPEWTLKEIASLASVFTTIPGWGLNKITMEEDGAYNVVVQSENNKGSTYDLKFWAGMYKYNVTMNSDQKTAEFNIKTKLNPRFGDVRPEKIESALTRVINKLSSLVQEENMIVGSPVNDVDGSKSAVVTVNLANATPFILEVIGEQIKYFSMIRVNKVLIEKKQDTFSILLKMTIWGN